MRAVPDKQPVTMPATENDPEWIVAFITHGKGTNAPYINYRKCATPEEAEQFFAHQREGNARIFRRSGGTYYSHSLVPVLRDGPRGTGEPVAGEREGEPVG